MNVEHSRALTPTIPSAPLTPKVPLPLSPQHRPGVSRPHSRSDSVVEQQGLTITTSIMDNPDPIPYSPSEPSPELLHRISWRILPVHFLLALCCYLDRTNLAFGALQMNPDLGFDAATYGLGAGIFFITYTLCQIPANMMLTRLGAPLWLALILLVWGGLSASMALVRTRTQFLALRLALGAAEAGTFPGIWAHLASFFPPRHLGEAYTRVATVTAVSSVVGGPLAALLMSLDGTLGLRGWQWLFLLEGLPTAALSVVIYLALPRGPKTATFLNRAERELIVAHAAAAETTVHQYPRPCRSRSPSTRTARSRSRSPSPTTATTTSTTTLADPQGPSPASVSISTSTSIPPPSSSTTTTTSTYSGSGSTAKLSDTLRLPSVWVLGGVWALSQCCMYGCTFWIPLILRHALGWDDPNHTPDASAGGMSREILLVSLMSAVPFLVATVAMLVVARLTANADARRVPLLYCLVGAALAMGFLAPATQGSPGGSIMALTVAAGFVWSIHGPFMSLPAILVPSPQRPLAVAAINSVGSLGGFVGPYAIGLASAQGRGFATAMGMLGVFLAMAGVLVWWGVVEDRGGEYAGIREDRVSPEEKF